MTGAARLGRSLSRARAQRYSDLTNLTALSRSLAHTAGTQRITVLHNLMIVDYSVGHTGSIHDSWAFRSTRTFKEHHQLFMQGEWLWADSAYPSEIWSVSPFKRPARSELCPDQRTFNYHLSKVRLTSLAIYLILFPPDPHPH